ncbi:hypothetical protein BH11BAC4_BH11BAC4_06340 [soil metagenome]
MIQTNLIEEKGRIPTIAFLGYLSLSLVVGEDLTDDRYALHSGFSVNIRSLKKFLWVIFK